MLQAQQSLLVSLRTFVAPRVETLSCLIHHRGESSGANGTVTGVNYFKKGEDPPLKPDSEYPDWLWEIAEPPPTLFNLKKKFGEEKTLDINDDNFEEVKRLVKLENLRDIKDRNFIKAKK